MGFDKRFTCTIDIVETELYRSYSSFGVESLPFVRIYRVPSSISKYGSSLTFSIQRLLPITGFRSPRLPEKLNVRSRPSGKTFVKYAADEVRAPPDQMMVRIGPCPQTASWLATISWAAGGFFFPQSWSVSRLYTSHFREPAFVNMRLSLAALWLLCRCHTKGAERVRLDGRKSTPQGPICHHTPIFSLPASPGIRTGCHIQGCPTHT